MYIIIYCRLELLDRGEILVKKNNLVSIIMPAYNAINSISQSIDSILEQSYTNWELIVVDDGSSDGTYEFVKSQYGGKDQIKLYRMPQNGGVAKARNKGLEKAKGRYIAFLDTDDTWKSTKLEKQIAFMQEKDCYFSYTSYDMKNSDGSIRTYQVPPQVDFKSQLKGSKIGTLTVMIDRSKTDQIYMRDIGHEDYVAWMELLKEHGPACGIQESLAIYDNSDSGISSNKFRAAKWQYIIYREVFNFSVFKSLYYFLSYSVNGLKKHVS